MGLACQNFATTKMASLNPAIKTIASSTSKTSVTSMLMAKESVQRRILRGVSRRICRRERHGDNKVGGGEFEQDKNEDLAFPFGRQVKEMIEPTTELQRHRAQTSANAVFAVNLALHSPYGTQIFLT